MESKTIIKFKMEGIWVSNHLRMEYHRNCVQSNHPEKYNLFRSNLTLPDEIEKTIIDETHKIKGDSINGYKYLEDDHTDPELVYLKGQNINIIVSNAKYEIIWVDEIDKNSFDEYVEDYPDLKWNRTKPFEDNLSKGQRYLQNEKIRADKISKYNYLNQIIQCSDKDFKNKYGITKLDLMTKLVFYEKKRLKLNIFDTKELPEFLAMQSLIKRVPYPLTIPNELHPIDDSGYISPIGKFYHYEAWKHISFLDTIKDLYPEYQGHKDDVLYKGGWLKMTKFQFEYNISDFDLLDNSKLINFIMDIIDQNKLSPIIFNNKKYTNFKELMNYLEDFTK